MVTIEEIGRALAKCSGYDPSHFSKPSQVVAEAWFEHFNQFPSVTSELVMDAVKVYYRTPDRKVPQPADISRIARDLWQEHFEREDPDGPLHQALEARSEAIAAPEPELVLEPSPEVKREAYRSMLESIATKRGVEHVLRHAPPSFTEDERVRALAALERAYPEAAAGCPVGGSDGPPGMDDTCEACGAAVDTAHADDCTAWLAMLRASRT